jgi:phosphatidylglycerophosphate synthase
LTSVPNLLSLSRALMAPVLLLLAWMGCSVAFLLVLLACYTTDILDGYFARKLKQVTEAGSRLDSTADRLIYLSMPFCAYWLRPELYVEETLSIVALVACFILPLVICYARFGKLSSYHTLSSKVAAVVFAISMITVFSGGPTYPLKISAVVFVFSALQDIAITMLLPIQISNVRSIMHARRLASDHKDTSVVS